MKLKEIANK